MIAAPAPPSLVQRRESLKEVSQPWEPCPKCSSHAVERFAMRKQDEHACEQQWYSWHDREKQPGDTAYDKDPCNERGYRAFVYAYHSVSPVCCALRFSSITLVRSLRLRTGRGNCDYSFASSGRSLFCLRWPVECPIPPLFQSTTAPWHSVTHQLHLVLQPLRLFRGLLVVVEELVHRMLHVPRVVLNRRQMVSVF